MDLSAPNLIATKKQKKSMPKKNTTKRTVKAASVKLPVKPTFTAGKSLSVTGYAGGYSRTKKVSIVAFVPAGENIFVAFATAYGFNVPNGAKNLEIRFGRAISKDARYIVREMKTSESNARNKIAAFYSPTVASVEKQNTKSPAPKKADTKSTTPAVTAVSTAPSSSARYAFSSSY